MTAWLKTTILYFNNTKLCEPCLLLNFFFGHSKVLFPDSKETWERINQKLIFWWQHGVETRGCSRDGLLMVLVEICSTLCRSEFVSIFLESLRIQCRVFLISFLSEPHPWHYLLLNSAFGSRYLTIIGWGWVWSEELWKSRRLLPAEADNNLRYLRYHSDHTTTESNKCFICYSNDFFFKNMLTSIDVKFPTSFGCF